MKKTFIVANWKSNKTIVQAKEWFQTINNSQVTINKEEKEVIICPSFTLLPFVKESIVKSQLSIVVGAQDISPFEDGAYTGEVNGKQIKEFAEFVIIGHSERRKNFFENDEIVNLKIDQAVHFGLTPILCISSIEQIKNSKLKMQNYNVKLRGNNVALRSSKFKIIIAYEPLFAIGSGEADTPENANSMAEKIREELGMMAVLYGGSVTSKNVKEFTQMSNIDGVLVGGASLDAQEFYEIIQNA